MSRSPRDDRLLAADLAERLRERAGALAHVVVIGTKPDIIKQAPVAREVLRRGEVLVLCHTGQHYDHNLSGALLAEFGLEVDVHLGVSGPLSSVVGQILTGFGRLVGELRELGLTPVPYVHGDTASAMAVAVSGYLDQVAAVHVEAGLRTATPTPATWRGLLDEHAAGRFSADAWRAVMRDPTRFEPGSREPFPEQFNTRVAEAGSGLHAAPVSLNRDALLAEGFPADTVAVLGNTVADATLDSLQRDAATVTVFETYPQLRRHRFVRVCVHRRENTQDPVRFRVLFDAVERLLVDGHAVLFIRLQGTEAAIDRDGLRPRLERLVARYPETFVTSGVWDRYADVVAAMRECAVVATDSGSMQEEMNVLGVGCVTLRFGTERAETLYAGCNVLAPPVDATLVARVVADAVEDPLPTVGNLYGTSVARAILDETLARAVPGPGLFRTEEARLRLH